ncbi:MAG: Esterase YbfF [Haliscomenobacter sp.]|jgi:esterase|nr:Esterase YbfF [Haliscomenobacter sp.]
MHLNYKVMGEGFPLVILHGLFGTLDNWQTLGKQLSRQFTVYLVDQRNHGRSPHLPHQDYPAMAEDLHQFMEAHWVYEAHVLGHSMGGKTAMEFALEYPDMVKKLVVVDIAPKPYESGHEDIFQALSAVDLPALTSRQEAEYTLRQYIREDGVVQFLLKNLSRHKDGHFEWKMNLPVLREYYDEILAPPVAKGYFTGETLFVRGGRSKYILDEDQAAIRTFFPNYRLETIPDAGHWVHAEAPSALLELVQAFLNG